MDVLKDMWHYYLEQDFSNRFVTAIIVFLIVFSILLLLGILISRTIKNAQEKKSNYWHSVFQEMLIRILFEPEYARGGKQYKKLMIEHKADKLDWIGRKALIEEMMELHKGVKGDSQVVVEQLYRDIGLVKFQEREINRGRWWQKAYAFRVYSEFGVEEKAKLVFKYVDHPNRTLRSEAQYAAVSLKGAGGLTFIQKLRSPISEWEQLVLLEKLVKFRPEDIPDVSSWLDSKNKSVVIFATKIIHQFRLFYSQEKLLTLLTNADEEIVLNAIECIVRIEYKDACRSLKGIFEDASAPIKEKVLMALASLGDNTNMHLFKITIENEGEFRVVMSAAKALKRLHGTAMLKQLSMQELKYPQNNEIVKHALDERI